MKKVPLTVNDMYETAAFQLLAQGMKDRDALGIIAVMCVVPYVWDCFETWADEETKRGNRDAI